MNEGKSFQELQEHTEFALAVSAEAEARAAIKAMREYVEQAEHDLNKLIAWKAAALEQGGEVDA